MSPSSSQQALGGTSSLFTFAANSRKLSRESVKAQKPKCYMTSLRSQNQDS